MLSFTVQRVFVSVRTFFLIRHPDPAFHFVGRCDAGTIEESFVGLRTLR